MMRWKRYIAWIVVPSALWCAVNPPPMFEVPKHWPKPQYAFKNNALTEAKVELGRMLFYDPRLSADSSTSCSSCHSNFTAFAHTDHARSHGIHDSIGRRNAPALMNLAWRKTFMWDGAVNHLDVQGIAPIQHPLEMANTLAEVVRRMDITPIYTEHFMAAYGDSMVTGERILKALSAFQLTLVSSNALYDRVQRGEATFDAKQLKGYQLFQQHCNQCHQEPLFFVNEYASNDLPIDAKLRDYGRGEISGQKRDSGLFQVPTLRNIEVSYPYMHDGRFRKLSDVMKHYSGEKKFQLGNKPFTRTLALTADDKVDLITFLETLTDTTFLLNKRYRYPFKAFHS